MHVDDLRVCGFNDRVCGSIWCVRAKDLPLRVRAFTGKTAPRTAQSGREQRVSHQITKSWPRNPQATTCKQPGPERTKATRRTRTSHAKSDAGKPKIIPLRRPNGDKPSTQSTEQCESAPKESTSSATRGIEPFGGRRRSKKITLNAKKAPNRGLLWNLALSLELAEDRNGIGAQNRTALSCKDSGARDGLPPEGDRRDCAQQGFNWLARKPRRIAAFPVRGELALKNGARIARTSAAAGGRRGDQRLSRKAGGNVEARLR